MTDSLCDLSGKFLSSIPDDTFERRDLTELDVSENELASVPAQVFEVFPALKTLALHSNKLTELPSLDKVACTGLSSISLEHNGLSSLPKTTFLQLANLRRLTLQNNKLSKLPQVLFELVNLTLLDMSENDLVDNDDWSKFASLVNLHTLYLDANELKGIPQGLFKMKALSKLSLKHNYVTNVPSGIAGLESLQELFLNNNKITKVPIHVYRLPKLRCVLLSGNPMDLNVKAKKSRIKAPKDADARPSVRSPWDALGAAKLDRSDATEGSDSAVVSAPIAAGSGRSDESSSLFGSAPPVRRAASSAIPSMGAPHYAGGAPRRSSGSTKGKRTPVPVFVNRAPSESSSMVDDSSDSNVDSDASESSTTQETDAVVAMAVDRKRGAVSPMSMAASASSEHVPALNLARVQSDVSDDEMSQDTGSGNINSTGDMHSAKRHAKAAKNSPTPVAQAVVHDEPSVPSDSPISPSKHKKRGLKAKFGKIFHKKDKKDKKGRKSAAAEDTASESKGTSSAPATMSPSSTANAVDAGTLSSSGSGWVRAAVSPGRETVPSPKKDKKMSQSAGSVPNSSTSPRKKKKVRDATSPRKRLTAAEKAKRAERRKSAKLERKQLEAAKNANKKKASTLKSPKKSSAQSTPKARTLKSPKSPHTPLSPLSARAQTQTEQVDGVRSLSPGQAADPIVKDAADQAMYDALMKDYKTPNVRPLADVSPRKPLPKSQFFLELRQDNDPVLQQVALEENEDAIFVQSAPVEALVRLLSHAWGFDTRFQHQFLVTMGAFVQPLELIGLLIERYEANYPSADAPALVGERTAVRERTLSFFDDWLHLLPRELVANRALRKRMLAFLKSAVIEERKHQSALESHAAKLSSNIRARMMSEAAALQGATPMSPGAAVSLPSDSNADTGPSEPPPVPYLPVNIQTESFAKLSILDLHPVEIARQLTLADHDLLRRSRLPQWVNCAWAGEAAASDAPTIAALINHFNNVSRWVSTEIVQADDVTHRVLLIKRFLIMANACAELANFNGVMQIISGVEAFAVQRLKKTWDALPKQSHKLYEDLCAVITMEDGDMSALRQRMAAVAPPCVPYIGPYLAELQMIDESSPTFSETGDVNFEKLSDKADIALELKLFMDTPYNLAPVDFIQDYLNSRILLDDDALTKQSLEREPLRMAKGN